MDNIQDILKIEGIGAKGGGILPKYVMLDPDLTLTAKCIYTYFSSLAGKGTSVFPGRDTIIRYLGIDKNTYYKHFNLLLEQNYIVRKQENSANGFKRNIYTLVSNPKKFNGNSVKGNNEEIFSKISFGGLKSAGYGWMPYIVMTDQRLNIKAKGIYAYFCVWTGSGNSAFPHKADILKHLGLSHNTYQNYYKQLIEFNYITVVQRRVRGKLSINDYYLIDNPDMENKIDTSFSDTVNVPYTSFSDTEKISYTSFSDTEKVPCTSFSDMEKISHTSFSDTEKVPCTNFSDTEKVPYANSSDIERVPYTSFSDTEKVPCTNFSDTEKVPCTNFSDTEKVPYANFSDIERVPYTSFSDTENSDITINNNLTINNIVSSSSSIRFNIISNMTAEDLSKAVNEVSLEYLYEAEDKRKQFARIHVLFTTILSQMCQISHIQYSGMSISKDNIIGIIKRIIIQGRFLSFCRRGIEDIYSAQSTRRIKNMNRYIQSCIYNALLLTDSLETCQIIKTKIDNKNSFHNFPQRNYDYDTMILEQISREMA